MKKIHCDYCDADLNFSHGIDMYRLNLSCSRLSHQGGFVIDVLIYPPIDEEKNFCGLGCLKEWLNK